MRLVTWSPSISYNLISIHSSSFEAVKTKLSLGRKGWGTDSIREALNTTSTALEKPLILPASSMEIAVKTLLPVFSTTSRLMGLGSGLGVSRPGDYLTEMLALTE